MSTLLEQASLVMIPSGYKEDVVYSQIPTDGAGDLSFTRASNGTRVNSAGLVEVCPWNLMEYSEQFDSPFWNKGTSGSATFVVTANATTAPNGTNTADLISITRSATSELAATYTFVGQGIGTFKNTIWLKAKDSSNVGKTIDLWSWEGDTRGYTKVTLTADWVRYEQNTTVFTGTASELFDFGLLPISYSTSTTLAVEFYAWGAQSNIGSTAKPYFPTTDRLNVPRLTYQNGGGGCPSLLLEKQSTNLALYSEQFDNAWWSKVNGGVASAPVVTANAEISPDGTQNADRIVFTLNGGTASGDISQLESTAFSSASLTRTQSVYIKTTDNTTKVLTFVTPTGAVQAITVTGTYQRFILTATGIAAGSIRLRLRGSSSGEGTATSASIAIWGMQYEESAYPTSYIPTTSSSATRVADACSKTGISSLIGQSEGTVFLDFVPQGGNITQEVFGVTLTGGGAEFIAMYAETNGNLYFITNIVSSTLISSNAFGQRFKVAYSYKAGTHLLYANGVQISATTFSSVYSLLDALYMNQSATGSGVEKLTTNEMLFSKTAFTATELASLTTI